MHFGNAGIKQVIVPHNHTYYGICFIWWAGFNKLFTREKLMDIVLTCAANVNIIKSNSSKAYKDFMST